LFDGLVVKLLFVNALQ